jgi:hypothetical protein
VGGLFVKKECNLYMKNGASIEQNKGESGGIYVKEEDFNLYMDKSFVRKNFSTSRGGGLKSNADATRVYMTGDSAFSENSAKSYAGGLEIGYSYFCIVSSDGTGKITNNKTISSDGYVGGLSVNRSPYEGNEGTIQGIEISKNKSAKTGGMYLGQEYVHLLDCTIKDNVDEKGDAGGVYVYNDNDVIDNCTITGNSCGKEDGGGGIYVYHLSDVELRGKCIIKGNVRSYDNSASDVYCTTMRATALTSPAVWRKARAWASAPAKPDLPR